MVYVIEAITTPFLQYKDAKDEGFSCYIILEDVCIIYTNKLNKNRSFHVFPNGNAPYNPISYMGRFLS